MQEADGFRIEAAQQYGFEQVSDDCPAYRCTESQLIAFAKACERKGLSCAVQAMRVAERKLDKSREIYAASMSAGISFVADLIDQGIAERDAELKPIREAEEARFMTAQGYVRATDDQPGARWIKPEPEFKKASCLHPCAKGAEWHCECHRRMGNDFFFLPADRCLDDAVGAS